MTDTPTLDWTCSRCGASTLYRLKPLSDQDALPRSGTEHPLPTLDWTCAHCGASHVYQLVPMAPVNG